MDNPPAGWTGGDERALVDAHKCKARPLWWVYLGDKVGLPCCDSHIAYAVRAFGKTWPTTSMHIRPIDSDYKCRHQDLVALGAQRTKCE